MLVVGNFIIDIDGNCTLLTMVLTSQHQVAVEKAQQIYVDLKFEPEETDEP